MTHQWASNFQMISIGCHRRSLFKKLHFSSRDKLRTLWLEDRKKSWLEMAVCICAIYRVKLGVLSEKDNTTLCTTKPWGFVKTFLGNTELCTVANQLSLTQKAFCGRKEYFKPHRLVLKIQYFWNEKSYQKVYVGSAGCVSNNCVWSLGYFPVLHTEIT